SKGVRNLLAMENGIAKINSGNLNKTIEALSKNNPFFRKAKHKTHCSLLITHCSLLIANCSLLIANCSLDYLSIVIKYEVYFSGCLKWLNLPRPILNAKLLRQNACRKC
ncbi:MAG: hypothetical protein J6U05_05935, partial [Neisseriaceae bacterium]|nr:hypothetical protein [Neisseriaceae bacterium]